MWALGSGLRAYKGGLGQQSPHITQRSPLSPHFSTLLPSIAAISLSIRAPFFNKPWMSSHHPRSTTTERVPHLQTAWSLAPAWSSLAPRRTSTSGSPEPLTSRDTASSGPARPASANPALWTVDGPPPCASAGGWRRSTTLLRLCGAAPRPTPANACPRWRSYATRSSTSRACRSCYESRWKTITAYLERAALSLGARCPAALTAW